MEFRHLPWSLPPEMDWKERSALLDVRPEDYVCEVADTSARFEAYFEEVFDDATGETAPLHSYSELYAGRWANAAGGTTYALVDPTDEMLADFAKTFGGGAWIVAAKYGYGEIDAACERTFEVLAEWCAAHPEMDVRPASAGVDEAHNCGIIGIDGADWQRAAAALEEVSPIYLRFRQEEQATADAEPQAEAAPD